jgi:hypothetical protein
MAEGEHTIIGKLPRERLNQIASRKLAALGVPVRLAADRETLEGDWTFQARVAHPTTGQPIARARFVVLGHDRLRFSEPPLSALGPVVFHDHDRPQGLEQAIGIALQERAAALQDLAVRMRALHLDAAIDGDRLAVRAVVRTPSHAFELLGGPEGVRVSRVAPVGGRPFEVAPEYPPLALQSFASAADLEGRLAADVGRMEPPSAPRPPPAAAGVLESTPPPRNGLTLAALARAFGNDAILAPNATVELVQEFRWGGTRYRFVATREMGTRFKGRLIGPSGDVWADAFDLDRFPGTRRVVGLALGAPEPGLVDGPPQPVDVAADGGGAAEVPHHLMPHAGEVWVMNVVVEQGGAEEVRYVGTDVDGRPYGAARVLKRSDFEAVFTQERGGWRLLVHVDQVQEGHVVYRQLDRARQPIGGPRRMAAAILVANFVPEAAAY